MIDEAHLCEAQCREGVHTVVAEASTPHFTCATVVFFPDEMRRARHIKLYERKGMQQLMPLITRNEEPSVYRCASALTVVGVLCPSLRQCSVHVAQGTLVQSLDAPEADEAP